MLLPIGRSEEGAPVTAVVVYSLIIANVLAFLIELVGGNDFISGYSVVPWEITHGEDLTRPIQVRGVGVIPQAPGPSPIYLTLLTRRCVPGAHRRFCNGLCAFLPLAERGG